MGDTIKRAFRHLDSDWDFEPLYEPTTLAGFPDVALENTFGQNWRKFRDFARRIAVATRDEIEVCRTAASQHPGWPLGDPEFMMQSVVYSQHPRDVRRRAAAAASHKAWDAIDAIRDACSTWNPVSDEVLTQSAGPHRPYGA